MSHQQSWGDARWVKFLLSKQKNRSPGFQTQENASGHMTFLQLQPRNQRGLPGARWLMTLLILASSGFD